MGIAKHAPELVVEGENVKIAAPKPSVSASIGGVSSNFFTYDLIDYFGINPKEISYRNVSQELDSIAAWCSDAHTVGEKLAKLRKLENKLGMNTDGQPRHKRIYNWVVLESNIKDLRGRQKSL
jgi:hypothetical protein